MCALSEHDWSGEGCALDAGESAFAGGVYGCRVECGCGFAHGYGVG